ncbi:hypothetical protein AAFC00_004430 [Neodothiora populina]|uniref:pectinesterase n=1 Tax=Neodothiora populina TaxID=2781224 RepID=A0ABR3P2A3_9PEZI
MVLSKSSLLLFSLLLGTTHAYDRGECQYPTEPLLQGCPQGTLLVGPDQKFTSVQSAVLSIPNDTVPYYILVLPGNYTEQVNITRSGSLTLLGQTKYHNDDAQNGVNIIWHNATGTASTGNYDNAYTSTLTVAPTLNSSLTGSGPTGNTVPVSTPFGNTDFKAYNLNFVNDYRPYSAGPSLALSVSYANASFYNCGFYSYQDTVYIGKVGNTYMYNSTVAGQTDFLYGFGTLWLQSCLLLMRGCGGGITAWKGTNTSFTNHYGVYVHDSIVRKANDSLEIEHKCALGRPWNALHRSIFANTHLDDSIQPSGYIEWSASDVRVNANTTMAEYNDFGPGFDAEGRALAADVTIELTDAQYTPYSTLEDIFQFPFSGKFGNTKWIDRKP